MVDNLPPSSADVTESGSLNLPETSGPHRPIMGLFYLFYVLQTLVSKLKCKMTIWKNFWNKRVPLYRSILLVIPKEINSLIKQMSSLRHILRLEESSEICSHINVSSSCTCGLYLLMFCETEGRANIWAVKCIPCIPVCTRAFRGFDPQQGSIACRFYHMFRLILRHLWFCVAFEIFEYNAANIACF
jgi:hypothetical protein